MKNKSINKIINKNILIIILILTITFGISYAFFKTNVKNVESSKTISIGGATFNIEYTGTETIEANNITPGWIGKKYFTVDITNLKEETINYNINLIVTSSNFYTSTTDGTSYLTYSLYSCTDENDKECNTKVADSKIIPTQSGNIIVKTVTSNITETKYYALTLEYPKLEVVQPQTGTDGKIVSFTGYVRINSSNKYFEGTKTIADFINNLDYANNAIEVDNTNDQNLRYVGSNPKNYIMFNDEKWRIIGVFNIYNTESEQYEKLVKITRPTSLGSYSWDTSDSSINSGYGINEWSQAKLMYELNCDGDLSTNYCSEESNITNGYLSDITSGTTTWYNGPNNAKNGTYNYNKNIKLSYLDKIANVRWNLGGIEYNNASSVSELYSMENNNNHIENPEDGIERTNYWDGKIGLKYISDYGYASTNSVCRDSMHGVYCRTNNWMVSFSNLAWTLTANTKEAYNGIEINVPTQVASAIKVSSASTANPVYPTLFLKSDTIIVSGTGTSADPYTIE